MDSNARELEEYTTLDNVITSYKLGLKALDEIEEFIKEYGNKCKYEKKDTLLYTSKEFEVKEMKEEYEIRKGNPDYTGRLCVIGSNLNEDKIRELY